MSLAVRRWSPVRVWRMFRSPATWRGTLAVLVLAVGTAAGLAVAAYAGEAASLAQIATRGRYPETHVAGTAQMMSRIRHVARSAVSGPQLIYVNYFGRDEAGPGGEATVAASIEYPPGTFTRVAFNHAETTTIQDGGQVTSDPVAVTLPDGATFQEWVWYRNPAGVIMAGTSKNVDSARFGESARDLTAGGGSMAGSDQVYGATALIGTSSRPAMLVVGDSRAGSPDNTTPDTNDGGNLARAIGSSLAYINVAVPGETVYQELVHATKRRTFARYCRLVGIAAGINDLNGSSAAEALSSLRRLVASYATDHRVFVSTVEPQTATGSTWTAPDGSDQIINTTVEPRRSAFNAAVLAGIDGAAGVFDFARVAEITPGSGKWKPLRTDDGLHGNQRYSADVATAHLIPPAALVP